MTRKLLLASLMASFMPCAVFATQASVYLGGGFTGTQIDLSGVGGGKDDIATPGASFGGQLLYDASKSIGLGIDLNYTQFGEKTSTKLAPVLDSTLNLKSTVVLAVAKWTALPEQKLRPYLLGGLGFHSSSFKYEGSPAAGLVWVNTGTAEKRTLVDDTKSALAGALGIGLDLDLTSQIFVGAEARFVYLGKVTWDATTQGQAFGVSGIKGDVSVVNLMAKLGFRF